MLFPPQADQSLPQGQVMDAEVEGEKERLRSPEKDGETVKRY